MPQRVFWDVRSAARIIGNPILCRFAVAVHQHSSSIYGRSLSLKIILALDALGRDDEARQLFRWVQALRNDDGSYWTGMVYPEEATYPPLERSTYTAGAMVLAADALGRSTPASGLFRGEGLPSHLDLTEPAPEAPVEPALRAPGTPGAS